MVNFYMVNQYPIMIEHFATNKQKSVKVRNGTETKNVSKKRSEICKKKNKMLRDLINKTHGNSSFKSNYHSKKLYKKNCRTNVRKYSFSQRVVDEWNKIPKKVIDSKTINTFKSQLNNHWKNLDIKFSPDIYQPRNENKLLRRVQGAE